MASARTGGGYRIERVVRIVEHLLGLEVDELALTEFDSEWRIRSKRRRWRLSCSRRFTCQ